MKKIVLGWILGAVTVGLVTTGYLFFFQPAFKLSTLSIAPSPAKPLPLLKYTIENLHQTAYLGSQLQIMKVIEIRPTYASFLFSYQTLGKKMTGLLNVPLSNTPPADGYPVILMVRGYMPQATYQPGGGTKNSAIYFAEHGYVTVAPDFFGYGGSEAESSDVWEARFQKPMNVVELFKTIQHQTFVEIPANILTDPQFKKLSSLTQLKLNTPKIGFWAHSNGGQIALTSLEILNQPIPTTLWAPVTAPFPYSVLFFSDEENDEGKASRAWVSLFEQDYDASQFSLTQHLNLLTGPLQLHQGLMDQNIHYTWSDKFAEKISQENNRRVKLNQFNATQSANLAPPLAPIQLQYFRYPNSNHDLQQDWSVVIQRDLKYFDQYLK